jgi:hypothetical protein
MIAGFRCFPSAVSIVVVAGTIADPELLFQEHLPFPVNETRPRKLAWFRRQVQAYLQRYAVGSVFFKRSEKQTDLDRAECEGVLQEAVASCDLQIVGRKLSQINRDTGFRARKPSEVKSLFQVAAFFSIRSHRPEFEDAALAALCGLDANGTV